MDAPVSLLSPCKAPSGATYVRPSLHIIITLFLRMQTLHAGAHAILCAHAG